MNKKNIAMILSVVMTASVMLAGCGKKIGCYKCVVIFALDSMSRPRNRNIFAIWVPTIILA